MLKFVSKFYFVKHYFSPLKTFMRKKGKDPEPNPDPYLSLIDPGGSKHADPDPVPDPDSQHWFCDLMGGGGVINNREDKTFR